MIIETTALIDSSLQVSSVRSQFCEELALEIQPLGQFLELEGTGGSAIPYLRFVEVNLQISGIQCYNEDVLLLVIPSSSSQTFPASCRVAIFDQPFPACAVYGISCSQVLF